MKIIKFCILLVLLIISGCSNPSSANLYDENDVIQLNANNKSTVVSQKMNLLKKSDKVATSNIPFTQVKAFIPNDEYKQYENVQGEKFLFLKIPKNKSFISGKIKYENNTKEKMKIQTLFLQGNNVAKIKPSNSSNWKSAITYNVPRKSSVTIDVDIKWDVSGMQELTFFPIDQTSNINRYDGGSLSNYRFFVQSKDISMDKQLLKDQSFNMNQTELSNEQNFFPIPSWVDNEKKELKLVTKDNKIFTKGRIEGLKLDKIPYNTKVNMLLVDEYGNTSLLAKSIDINKNKSTFINIDSNKSKKIYGSKNRKFVIIFNNRGEEMLADLKTLDMHRKPFSTSYQGVIEVYQNKK
ncbi:MULTISPECIES: hypothetical protein [Priestia]|uniref:hypothetical protein n=1 Tax=Priestia TaxID=2800373 RepID=UPI0013F3FFDD|nr:MULTISPECIES: hypothetical protein [Priestia]UPK52768.1 hypothetical protein MT476_26790 [Bacillus sp. H8-1]MDT0150337.1 hypothetical protein [Priestia aryabhattai]MDT0155469.1 hypothetical protein [Priestia aryabhattai]NGY89782.1 hypothetical protein [Priestia megaterium]WDC91191.1 hypothetical protein PSR56_27765 [Priestia megaterium]